MKKLTYPEAYDLIIQAYFRDEIQPMNGYFCFCGTLANGIEWRNLEGGLYTYQEYRNMEWILLYTINHNGGSNTYRATTDEYNEKYEDALFAGMSAALDVLKEIHRSRGEDVDSVAPAFTKRELVLSQ